MEVDYCGCGIRVLFEASNLEMRMRWSATRFMNILIVEDNKFRIQKFKEELSLHDTLFITDNTKLAIGYLQKNKVNVVFLDHDLKDKHYVVYDENDGEDTGREVAEFLANTMFDGLVVIHSWNPVGSKVMEDVLNTAGVKISRAIFGMPEFEHVLKLIKDRLI